MALVPLGTMDFKVIRTQTIGSGQAPMYHLYTYIEKEDTVLVILHKWLYGGL